MSHPIVIDVIGRDRTGAAMKSAAESQKNLARQIDATNKGSDNLRKSQLGLIAAQERYNKVAKDTGSSVGQLASAQKGLITAQQRVAAETKKATTETEKFANTADKAHAKFNPLVDSALLLGPALVPIGAAAVAAGAGLAGLGAAGILAFKGIQAEMKQGTALGKQYQATFAPVVDEFHQLEHIAASNVFGGINKGIQESRTLFPQLNQDIAALSTHMGNIAGSVGAGLVALFHDLNPLFLGMADALDQGAGAFQRWAQTSDAPKKFVAYAQAQLPKVESLFRAVATAVVHIGEAAAPIGSVLLPALSGIAQAIARIPTPVLTAMIVAFDIGRLGAIAQGLGAVSKALQAVGFSAGVANPVILGLTIIAGVWAAAQGQAAQQSQALAQATNDVTAALQASSGAFNDDVRAKLAKTAADTGATKSLDTLGLSQQQYFDALVSGKDAQNAEIQRVVDRAKALGLSKAATIQLLGPLAQQVNAVQQGTDKWNAEAKAMGNAGVAISAQDTALKGSNLTLGEAQQKFNDAYAAAHTFDAELGYMSKALDTLSNNNITATLQQDQLNLAMGTAADKFAASRKQVAEHGHALEGNTADAISNRDWALQQIQAINQQAISYAKSTGSIGLGTGALKTNEAALRTSMAQAGFTKGQIDKLITTYAATPSDVETSIREQGSQAVLTALGDILNQLHAIADPVWGAKFDFAMNNPSLARGFARGGRVQGPGGPTADMIPARLSAGEYVVNAQATSKHLALLENLNRNKYAAGGLVGNLNIDMSAARVPANAFFGAFGGAGGPATIGGNLGAWIAAALAITGTPAAWGAAIQRRIMFESGGNPNAINLWDSNAMAGDPSRGLMQTIGATFNAYHQAGTSGNIFDPVANIAAAINYIKSRYGSIFAIDPPVQGYRTGAWEVASNQLAGLHKGEMVLPADIAELVRSGVGKGLSPRAIAVAVAEALAGMEFRFDGDGLARLVTSRQTAYAVRGGRR